MTNNGLRDFTDRPFPGTPLFSVSICGKIDGREHLPEREAKALAESLTQSGREQWWEPSESFPDNWVLCEQGEDVVAAAVLVREYVL